MTYKVQKSNFLAITFELEILDDQSKGFKDLYSLISKTNFSQIIDVGSQGLVTSAKNVQTYPNYDVTYKKLKSKIFHFFKSEEDLFIFEGFEQLSSSVASYGGAKWHKKCASKFKYIIPDTERDNLVLLSLSPT